MSDDAPAPPYETGLVGLSAIVYVQRDGKILVLKRAGGEATGAWYVPGGAVEPGEDVEDAARRELFEESGLIASTPLILLGAHRIFVYGHDVLQLSYVCDCPDGDVVLSEEHSGARWIDPLEYRERYFKDEYIAAAEASSARFGSLLRAVRGDLDRYLAWREARTNIMPP